VKLDYRVYRRMKEQKMKTIALFLLLTSISFAAKPVKRHAIKDKNGKYFGERYNNVVKD